MGGENSQKVPVSVDFSGSFAYYSKISIWTTSSAKRVKNTKNGHFGLRLGLFCDSIVIYVNYCAHTRAH